MSIQQQSPSVNTAKKIFVLPHVLPRRCRDFTNIIGDKSIMDYLNISPRKNENISFAMELFPEQRYSIFSVDFMTQNTPTTKPTLDLPMELCDIIHSYSSNFISLKFRIDYPGNYPFDQPIWSLISEKNDMTHLPKNFVLSEYFQELADRHNGQYSELSRGYNWSPSMTIRTDMINFIMIINHFDVIADYSE